MREFEAAIRKTTDLTGRLLVDVLKQQAGLIARDAMRLTPPFGKNPFKESFGSQKKLGDEAVAKDVSLAFKPLSQYRIVGREWHFEHGNLGVQIQKAVKKKDFVLAEALLEKIGLKPLAIIRDASLTLHQNKGGRKHRFKGPAYRVANERSITRLRKELQSQVGEAKAGWVKAIRMFERAEKVPRWIARHGERGGVVDEHPSTDKPSVTVGNSIAYVQDRAPQIVDVVWRVRVNAAKQQAKHIERAMKKKAAESGVTVT
jgi:hypothetical protein